MGVEDVDANDGLLELGIGRLDHGEVLVFLVVERIEPLENKLLRRGGRHAEA